MAPASSCIDGVLSFFSRQAPHADVVGETSQAPSSGADSFADAHLEGNTRTVRPLELQSVLPCESGHIPE